MSVPESGLSVADQFGFEVAPSLEPSAETALRYFSFFDRDYPAPKGKEGGETQRL